MQPQSSYKTLSTPLPQPKPLAFAQYVAEERKFKAQFESVLKTKFSALSVAPFSPSSIPTIATDSFASVCSSKTEIEKNQNPHEEKHIKNEKSPENDEKETEMEKEVLLRSSAELLSAHAEGYVCEGQGRAAKDCRLAFSYMLRGRGPAALGFLSSAAPMEQIVSILSGDAALSEAEAADAAAALSSEKTVLRCFLFAAPVIVGAPSSSAAEALKKELFSGNKSNFIARAEFQATVLGRLAASGELGGAFKRFAWRLLALLANGGGRQRFGMKLARIVFEVFGFCEFFSKSI